MKFFALVLASLLSLTSSAYAASLNRIVAVVNDEPITEQQLSQHLAEAKKLQNHSQASDNMLRAQVLNYLIRETAELQQAHKFGLRVTEAEINSALTAAAQQQGLSLEAFTAKMLESGLTKARLNQQLKTELLLSKLYQRVVAPEVSVSEKEIDHFLASPEGQRQAKVEYHLQHLLIALPPNPSAERLIEANKKAEFIAAAVAEGEAFDALAIAHSDASNAINAGDLGWRKGAEVPSLFSGLIYSASVGEVIGPIRNDSGLHFMFIKDKRTLSSRPSQERHFRHILVKNDALYPDGAIVEMLNLYKAQIESGDYSFEALAREHSEDIITAHLGGDMGWVSPSDVPSAFAPLWEKLAPGEISAPIKSAFGWHLVEHAADAADNTIELRADARRWLHMQKFEERLQAYQQRLLAEAYVVSYDG